MLKKKYIDAVTNILHFLNYNKIEKTDGNNRIVLNSIDLAIAFSYVVVSFYKLDTVTAKLVFIINLLTLSRLMMGNIKNSVNLRDAYKEKYLKRPGLEFKSAHDLKLIIEFCVIAFELVPFCIQGDMLEENTIQVFAGTVIIIGFLENLISVFIELFKASIDI